MGSYFKTVFGATKEAFSAVADAAKVIAPATKEATKETVTKINEWSDKTNEKLSSVFDIQSSADVTWDEPALVEDVPAEPALEEGAVVEPEKVLPDVSKAYAYPVALTALMKYVSMIDDDLADEEMNLLERNLNSIANDPHIPDDVKIAIEEVAKRNDLTFEDVTVYLDKVSPKILENLQGKMSTVINADGVVTPEEEALEQRFLEYLEARKAQ